MYKLFSFVLAALVFVSCKNSGSQRPAEAVPTPTTITTPVPVQGADQPATTTTPANNTPANPGATAALNPAHGAPGHRCDIPVGAPLNSPAGGAAPPVAAPAPVQFQPPILSQPPVTNGNARLNPAHGQPGHDCSVPVGQPLKG